MPAKLENRNQSRLLEGAIIGLGVKNVGSVNEFQSWLTQIDLNVVLISVFRILHTQKRSYHSRENLHVTRK